MHLAPERRKGPHPPKAYGDLTGSWHERQGGRRRPCSI